MQRRSKATRHRILSSSLRLFAKNGYEATGVAEICEAADVSKGAFYHHFPTKQAIFVELLNEWLIGVNRQLASTLRGSSTVPEGLLAMASRMKSVFGAADGRLEIFLEFWQQARRDPLIRKGVIAPYRQYRDILAEVVQKGIDEGSLRRVDTKVAGQALETLAVGTLLQGILDPKGARWESVVKDSVGLLLEGMTKPRRAGNRR